MTFFSFVSLNFFLLVVFCHVSCINLKAKTVTTLIDAKWEATPIVLEVAEYIAEESKDDFWSYLDDISKLKPHLIDLESDKLHYDSALKVVSIFQWHISIITVFF